MEHQLTSKKLVQRLGRELGIAPSKEKGQNFLIDENVIHQIMDVAEVGQHENILEVGPGFGVLTTELSSRSDQVLAVEIDNKLCEGLQKMFFGGGVTIHCHDILKMPNREILAMFKGASGYKVISNLPYSITSHFVRKFLEQEPKPNAMVLMIQKEVAKRMVSEPGEMSILSVSVQLYADPELKFHVPKRSFWPEPEVDSSVVVIKNIRSNEEVENEYGIKRKEFFQLVRVGFSARRKKLVNNIASGVRIEQQAAGEWLGRAGVDLGARAQELSVKDWVRLLRNRVPF